MSKWVHKLSNIDEINKTATCANCGFVKIQSKGGKPKTGGLSRFYGCSIKYRAQKLGLDFNEVFDLLKLKACQLCGDDTRLCIDHNHTTGKLRGILCNKCNKTLGYWNDDPKMLQRAIDYLNK